MEVEYAAIVFGTSNDRRTSTKLISGYIISQSLGLERLDLQCCTVP